MVKDQSFLLGDVLVDPTTNVLTIDGEEIKCRKKVIDLLMVLASNFPSPVSREELISKLWEGNTYSGKKAVTDTIFEVRQILKDDCKAPKFIQTVPKIGYRLLEEPKSQFKSKPTGKSQVWVLAAVFLLGFSVLALTRSAHAVNQPPVQIYELSEALRSGEHDFVIENGRALLAGQQTTYDRARTNLLLGEAYMEKDLYRQSAEHAIKASEYYAEIGHERGLLLANISAAYAHIYLGNQAITNSYLEKVDQIAPGLPVGQSIAARVKTFYALWREDYGEATYWAQVKMLGSASSDNVEDRTIYAFCLATQGEIVRAHEILERLEGQEFDDMTGQKCGLLALARHTVNLESGQLLSRRDWQEVISLKNHENRFFLEAMGTFLTTKLEPSNHSGGGFETDHPSGIATVIQNY